MENPAPWFLYCGQISGIQSALHSRDDESTPDISAKYARQHAPKTRENAIAWHGINSDGTVRPATHTIALEATPDSARAKSSGCDCTSDLRASGVSVHVTSVHARRKPVSRSAPSAGALALAGALVRLRAHSGLLACLGCRRVGG